MLFVWNAAGLYAALFVLTWPGTFVATRDLTAVPLLCVASALIAFALWYLLAEKRLTRWSGIGASAVACILMLLIAPWPAVILPLAIAVSCWIARRRQQQLALAQWPLLAWAAAAYLAGYWLEANPYNPLTWLGPVLPMGLLLGGWLADREAFADQAKTRRTAYAIFVVGLVASALLIFFAIEGPLGFSFFTSSVVLTSVAGRIPFIVLAAALIAGVTGNLVYRLHNNARAANCFLAGMLAGVIVAFQVGFVVASPAYSSQILADAIRPELEPTDVVVVDGKYPEASSFAFYLQRPVLSGPTPRLKGGRTVATSHRHRSGRSHLERHQPSLSLDEDRPSLSRARTKLCRRVQRRKRNPQQPAKLGRGVVLVARRANKKRNEITPRAALRLD